MKKMFKFFAAACIVLTGTVQLQICALAAEKELIPMGNAVGIHMEIDGVMVVKLTEGESGDDSPASKAGLLPGDIIVQVDETKTPSSADFLKALEAAEGGTLTLTVRRGGDLLELTLTPEVQDDGEATIGVWLRDGITGTGTLTYYDPETGCFGALGHGITDLDTGAVMPLDAGVITETEVTEIKKGVCGKPGELCGSGEGACLGEIEENTPYGIFGTLHSPADGEPIPVAGEDEIALGPATILANVAGDEIQEYEVEIIRIYKDADNPRSMMIRVTDPALLKQTGGIVQGMSGSPILQNGKLVGAVTHVLVNNPEKGYGISAEDMLNRSRGQ